MTSDLSTLKRDGVEFLDSVPGLLKEAGVYGPKVGDEKIIEFEHPLELERILQLSLEGCWDSCSDADLLETCRQVLRYSVKTGNRGFHNQLFAGVDNYALAGSWMTEALNTSQYTFEVAPAFTLAEQAVLRRSARMFGLQEHDGIFCPGGSTSNMYAVVMARYRAFPQVKAEGLTCLPPLAAFTSQDSHYSMQKSSHWLGLGTNNLIKVTSDQLGRMRPDVLRKEVASARERGQVPFIVNATAGTTVLGAFDPLDEIADVCKEFGLWLHIDACWGGSLMFSEKYKGVLKGIERADSISWNPHKMLGVPLQCSIFLTRHTGVLHNCNSASAHYLFQEDKFYDVAYDTGDKSVQCGRKVDAFKLWLMWKARGESGLRALVDTAMSCSEYFLQKISGRPGFELVIPAIQCTNVCFWYVPPGMRGQERNEAWWNKINMVAPKIKERMIKAGTLMIGYTPLDQKGLKNFFRFVVSCQPLRSFEDMDFVIESIETYGKDPFDALSPALEKLEIAEKPAIMDFISPIPTYNNLNR